MNLLGQLLAGEDSFLSVDDDDVVAAVNMWGKDWFMFAAQQVGSFGSGAAQRLVCSVDHIPFTGNVLCFWHCCRH